VLPEQAFVTPTTDEGTWRIVCALPKQQRAVIALRFYLDVIVAETAELLNCAPGTVKSHTARALAKLKISIQEADELS